MESYLFTRVQHYLSHYDYTTAIFIGEQLLSQCFARAPPAKLSLAALTAALLIDSSTSDRDSGDGSGGGNVSQFTHSVILLLSQCYYECGNGLTRAYHLLHDTLPSYTDSCSADEIHHRYLLGRCCYELEMVEEAETVLLGAVSSPVLTQSSHASSVYHWLGVITQLTGRTNDAIDYYRRAIACDGWNWSAFKALSTLGVSDENAMFTIGESELQTFNANVINNTSTNSVPVTPAPNQTQSQSQCRQPLFVTPATRSLTESLLRAAMPSSTATHRVPPMASLSSITETRTRKQSPSTARTSARTNANSNANRTPHSALATPTTTASVSASHRRTGSISKTSTPVSAAVVARRGSTRVQAPATKGKDAGNDEPFKRPAPRAAIGSVSGTVRVSSPRRSPRFSGTNAIAIKSLSSTTPAPSHVRTRSRSQTQSATVVSDEDEVMMEMKESTTENPPHYNDNDDELTLSSSVINPAPLGLTVSTMTSVFRTVSQAFTALSLYQCRDALSLLQSLPPSTRHSPLTQSLIARCYFELLDWPSAIHCYQHYHRRWPCHLEGLEYYSTALWQCHKETELSSLSLSINHYPYHRRSPVPMIVAANCHSLQKDHALALQFLIKAHDLDAHCAYALTLAGHESVLNDDLNTATGYYRRALSLDGRAYGAWFGLADVLSRQEKYTAALYHFHQAALIHPASTPILVHLAKTHLALNDYDSAKSVLERAQSLEENSIKYNPQIDFHWSQLLMVEHQWEPARAALLRVVQVAPREPSVYAALARAARAMGDSDEALRCASLALDLDSKDSNGAKQILDALLSNGQINDANDAC